MCGFKTIRTSGRYRRGGANAEGGAPTYCLGQYFFPENCIMKTRKHSSRMRTTRCCGSGRGGGRLWSQWWGYGSRAREGYGPRGYGPCENITFPQLRWQVVIRKIGFGKGAGALLLVLTLDQL